MFRVLLPRFSRIELHSVAGNNGSNVIAIERPTREKTVVYINGYHLATIVPTTERHDILVIARCLSCLTFGHTDTANDYFDLLTATDQ